MPKLFGTVVSTEDLEAYVDGRVALGGGVGTISAIRPYVVAASDAPTLVKSLADVVCDSTTTTNTSRIWTALADSLTLKRPTAFVGNFTVELTAHPVSAGYYTGIVVRSGNKVDARQATFKLSTSVWPGSNTDGRRYSFLTNYNKGDVASPDRDIEWVGGVFDGQAALQPTTGGTYTTGDGHSSGTSGIGVQFDGIELWRTHNCTFRDVIAKNMRGTSGGGGPNETFHFDTVGGAYNKFIDCTATSDDGGDTSSGFSANSSEGILWDRCWAYNMDFHGMTMWESFYCKRNFCYSFGNRGTGLRVEEGHDNLDVGCTSGGSDRYNDTYVRDLFVTTPNSKNALNLKQTRRYRAVGCNFSFNLEKGIESNHSRNCIISATQLVGNVGVAIYYADNIAGEIASGVANTNGPTGTYSQLYVDPSCYIARNNGATDADNFSPASEDTAQFSVTTGSGDRFQTIYGTGRHNVRASGVPGAASSTTNVYPLTTDTTFAITLASGTYLENYYPFEMEVNIYGGTVTAVNVRRFGRAVQVANDTGVQVILPPGDAIAITYSVAPSWSWRARFRSGPSLVTETWGDD